MAVIDRPAPGRARLGVAVAAERQVMAAEEPGIRRFSFGLAEDHRPAALERAAGVPLAVAAEAFAGFVVGQDRPQRPLDQLLLRLGVGVVESRFSAAERRRVVRLLPRRMSFGAMIVGQHQLALLIRRERGVQLLDQALRPAWVCASPRRAWPSVRTHRGQRRSAPIALKKSRRLRTFGQIETFIALGAIESGFVEHDGSPAEENGGAATGVAHKRATPSDAARGYSDSDRRKQIILSSPPDDGQATRKQAEFAAGSDTCG